MVRPNLDECSFALRACSFHSCFALMVVRVHVPAMFATELLIRVLRREFTRTVLARVHGTLAVGQVIVSVSACGAAIDLMRSSRMEIVLAVEAYAHS